MNCEGCGGKCCRVLIVYPKANIVNAQIELWKVRGALERDDCLLFPAPCPLFDEASGLCTDYENRPRACRDYDAGSPCCLMARKL